LLSDWGEDLLNNALRIIQTKQESTTVWPLTATLINYQLSNYMHAGELQKMFELKRAAPDWIMNTGAYGNFRLGRMNMGPKTSEEMLLDTFEAEAKTDTEYDTKISAQSVEEMRKDWSVDDPEFTKMSLEARALASPAVNSVDGGLPEHLQHLDSLTEDNEDFAALDESWTADALADIEGQMADPEGEEGQETLGLFQKNVTMSEAQLHQRLNSMSVDELAAVALGKRVCPGPLCRHNTSLLAMELRRKEVRGILFAKEQAALAHNGLDVQEYVKRAPEDRAREDLIHLIRNPSFDSLEKHLAFSDHHFREVMRNIRLAERKKKSLLKGFLGSSLLQTSHVEL
jgi:hypothetical protein